MSQFLDVATILKASASTKGGSYDADAIMLGKLFDDQARSDIIAHLKTRGLGRPQEDHPLHFSLLRRIIDSLSVVYRTPAVRRLVRGGRELTDANEAAKALAEVYGRMMIDTHWQVIDGLRNLYRTVAVVFSESGPHRCVQVRTFEPYNLHRVVDPMASDTLETDERFLLQIRSDTDEAGCLYQAWTHDDSGAWRMHVVDGHGEMPEGIEQPYGESGTLPWGGALPVMLVYDELPRGRAYLPIPQSRIDFPMALNSIVADIQYLVQMEAHTPMVLSSDRSGDVPTETGTGKIYKVSKEATLNALTLNPKLAEAGAVLDQIAALWLTGEAIPGDDFRATQQVQTGAALRVRNRDLEARRQRQTPLAACDERVAYEKIRAVHNTFAAEWGLPMLAEDVELRVSIGRAWQPADPKELQDRYFKNIAIGVSSPIDYIMDERGISRADAIAEWTRVQEDLALYPVKQNPGAMVQDAGPLVAAGPGSATKTPGEFNPDLGTATEGASVIDAAKRKMMAVPAA